MDNKVKKAAIYLRMSSDEIKNPKHCIAYQEDELQKFCHAQDLFLSDKNIYIDAGYSGTLDINERPGLKRLVLDAKRGAFDILIVYRLDRLFRNYRKLLETTSQLTEYGVTLQSATEAIDTGTADGELMFQLLGSFAELERNTVRERAKHECLTCGRFYEPNC